jgi:hypothetical protein
MFALFEPYIYVLIPVLLFVSVVLIIFVVRLEIRLRRLTRGKDGTSLEGTINNIVKEQEEILRSKKLVERTLHEQRAMLGNAVRGVAVERFNALSGNTSGKQSFAVAILSERGDGVVISSLHARDHARAYAKPIKNFLSEHELTDEEKQAILKARKSYVCPHTK